MRQVQALGNWIGPTLTLGTTMIVVGAFEDEMSSAKKRMLRPSPQHNRKRAN